MALMTPAQARENFLAAMNTLRSSKVRSALTVLGIVIGVSSVISMAAIIGRTFCRGFHRARTRRAGRNGYGLGSICNMTMPTSCARLLRTYKS